MLAFSARYALVLRRMQGVVPDTGTFEAWSHLAGKLWYGTSQSFSGLPSGMPPEELQNHLWKDFFSAPTQWWDNRQSKPTSRHPDFKHKKSKVPLWLNDRHKPPWVDTELATWDAGVNRPPDSVSTSSQRQGAFGTHERRLNVDMCSKLFEDGRMTDAVVALGLLVQQGCSVHNNLYYRILKRCIASKDLVLGRRIHALTIRSGYEGDAFLATHLIGLYTSHGRLEEAMRVFTKVSTPDAYVWAAMIFGCARHGEAAQAIRLYKQMRESTVKPDNRIYSAVLKACATAGDLVAGKEVHAHILTSPGKPDIFVQNGLLDMYAKCRSLADARSIFDSIPDRNVVTWNVMIAGYAQQGLGQEALNLYNSMQQEGLSLDSVTLVCLLQACATVGAGALHEGKQLHTQIEEKGLQADMVLGSSLVNMYAKCGSLEDARNVFDRLPQRNVVTWTAMIAGYSRHGKGLEALTLYNGMQQEGLCPPDSVTFIRLLQACTSVGVGALHEGRQLHAQIEGQGLQDDVALCCSLVNMYAKCGSVEDARRVFDSLPDKNMVTWNTMLAGYTQQGMGQEALSLYGCMQQDGIAPPDSFTFVCVLQACAMVGGGALHQGKQIHEHITEKGLDTDVVLGGSLVNMYAKCGSVNDARGVFDRLPERNVVTWNAMLAGYAKQGMGQEALHLHNGMQQEGLALPDSVTFLCLLQACASVGAGALQEGKQLHAQIEEKRLQNDMVLGCSLINMYAKCGSVEDARRVFDTLPEKDMVTWTAMIAGYARQGMGQEALGLFNGMQQEGLSPPDSATFVCVLQACAIVAGLPLGRQCHAQIKERGIQTDLVVGAALVNMYAKCGSMLEAQQVFDSLPERNMEAWGALIGGYALQGDSEVVFALLGRMRLEGMQPSDITFLSVLTVCSHVGLVDKGRKYFESMRTDYGISPTLEHYTCMMDLLGRAGHLDEALQLANTMPFPPDGAVWHTLLGACQKWNNFEIGQRAFESAVRFDGKEAASHVLMSNIYAKAEMWEEAKEMQVRRKKLGAWKKPGQSWWTDMGGVVHTFVVGDKKHAESEGIYARLEQLLPRMKKEGYVPHLQSSLRDIPDDEKASDLCGHSEKLAIAYALNKTPEGATIRIVKNLRVCEDCHTATAYISKVEKRTIICRDASRFHVYKEGKCSCGDYW